MSRYTDFGNVKTTDNQTKKHYSMMNYKEFREIRSRIYSSRFSKCDHVSKKKYIVKGHICTTLNKFDIIEFNTNWKYESINNRVLVRSKEEFLLDDGSLYNLCVVLSLTTKEIVTAYYNLSNDSHENIDMSRYEDFDIIDLLEMED